MSQTKILVKFKDREFKIKVQNPCSVGSLQLKIRRYLKLTPLEAVFLFFQVGYFGREVLVSGDRLVSSINNDGGDVLVVKVLLENTFGTLDRRFLSATISELGSSSAWCLRIKYSFYNLYDFTEVYVFKSQQECERKLLVERTHGFLSIKDKNGQAINIEPSE